MIVKEKQNEICYYEPGPSFSPRSFAAHLGSLIEGVKQTEAKKEVLFLCIGSDRSTGDSLGPIIGYKLEHQLVGGCRIVGTLSRPVHAVNLEETVEEIQRRYPAHVVVAIDASIGRQEQVGTISLGRGGIRPGLGVRKRLNRVGDIFITGVVGNGQCREPMMLQSIRLGTVMELADAICSGIKSVETFLEFPDRN